MVQSQKSGTRTSTSLSMRIANQSSSPFHLNSVTRGVFSLTQPTLLLSTCDCLKETLFTSKRIHYSSLLELDEIDSDSITDQFRGCFETEVPHNFVLVRLGSSSRYIQRLSNFLHRPPFS